MKKIESLSVPYPLSIIFDAFRFKTCYLTVRSMIPSVAFMSRIWIKSIKKTFSLISDQKALNFCIPGIPWSYLRF